MPIYLDFNATTPIDQRVLDRMCEVYRDAYGNAGSRTHSFGQNCSRLIQNARTEIASGLGAESNEIVFTSGASEANNLAILGLAEHGTDSGKTHIISTETEHKSILEPLDHLSKHGFDIDLIAPDIQGQITTESVLAKLRGNTLLVTLHHANNETGVLYPVEEIGEALRGKPVFFHIDAAQSFGKLPIDKNCLHFDLLSISGHKIYGPQGIGALVAARRDYRLPPLKPLMHGGGQEYGLRPGTLPVPLIVALATAAKLAYNERDTRTDRMAKVKDSILAQLSDVEHTINGSLNSSLANTLNLSFTGVDSAALMLFLKEDYALSNGSACTSKDYQPSHVLTAMGLPEDTIDGAIRISWGPNSECDMTRLVQAVKALQ